MKGQIATRIYKENNVCYVIILYKENGLDEELDYCFIYPKLKSNDLETDSKSNNGNGKNKKKTKRILKKVQVQTEKEIFE